MDSRRLVAELAGHLSAPNGAEGFAPVLVALLRELARGVPVPIDALALRTGLPAEEVRALLRQAGDTEWGEAGHVIGYGLTLVETPHHFEVEGRRLYTWCAFDTLFFPALIDKTARVRSRCPVTQIPIVLEVSPSKLECVEPRAAAMSIVLPPPASRVRETFCCNVHFFASAQAGSQWAHGRADAMIMGVKRGHEIGKALAHAVSAQP